MMLIIVRQSMAVQVFLSTMVLLLIGNSHGEIESCTRGFPSTVVDCYNDCEFGLSTKIIRIIPWMNFTCTGTITEWKAGAFFNTTSGHDGNAILGIWRERSNQQGTYDKVATIELRTCGSGVEATLVTGMSRVYQCTLPESLRVSVQPGDIVGIERELGYNNGTSKFGLLFNNSNQAMGPMIYVFTEQPLTITLNEASDTIPGAQPQISLTVEVIHPRMEGITNTQVHSTPAIVHTTVHSRVTTGIVASSPGYPTSQEPTTFEFTSEQIARNTLPLSLIIAAVAGGGVMVVVLFLAITLALVCLIRRHCKVRESGLADDSEAMDKDNNDMDYNEAYVQFQIPTEENVCYGLIENQDDIHYDTIDIPGAAHHDILIRNEPSIYSNIV